MASWLFTALPGTVAAPEAISGIFFSPQSTVVDTATALLKRRIPAWYGKRVSDIFCLESISGVNEFPCF
jgi:hypothetical protein